MHHMQAQIVQLIQNFIFLDYLVSLKIDTHDFSHVCFIDELYSNAIPGSRPRKKPLRFKPSSFAPINHQKKHRPPYHNVRINNSFRPHYHSPKNWATYTQVIFHPARPLSEVIDITLAPSSFDFAETNTVEKIAITTRPPQIGI